MPESDEPGHKGHAPFVMVDVPLLRDPTITPLCKVLYALLISFGPDRIFPSHGTLAQCAGVSRRKVMRGLQELRRDGWIDWSRTGRSNRYHIIRSRCAPEDTPDVSPDTHQTCDPEHIRCAPGDTRSRSIDPDPSTQRERAEAAAPPSQPVSSPTETDGDDAQPPRRSKQEATDKAPPAVETLYGATDCRPPRSWYSDLDQAVGNAPADLAFWYDVCRAYVGQGWNPRNVQAMLDYYHRREIPCRSGSPPNNGRRPRADRPRGRGEYQSYAVSERDALWAKHKDRYLTLVDRGLDPDRQCSTFAQVLGLTAEKVYMLRAAHSAQSSMHEFPLDPSLLDEEP